MEELSNENFIDMPTYISHFFLFFLLVLFFFVIITILFKLNLKLNNRFIKNFKDIDLLHNIFQKHHSLSSKQWTCSHTQNGRRIWIPNGSFFPDTSSSNVCSLSFLSNLSIKQLLNAIIDPMEFVEWNFIFKVAENISSTHVNSKELNLERCHSLNCKTSLYFLKFNFATVKCRVKLRWKCFQNSILIIYEPELPFSNNRFMIIFYLSTLSQSRCLSQVIFTILKSHCFNYFYPSNTEYIDLASSLYEYTQFQQNGAYLQRKNNYTPYKHSSIAETNSKQSIEKRFDNIESNSKIIKSKYVFQHENENEYISKIDETANKILHMCSGIEKDGWIRVGKNKSVEVWRLDPTPGEIQFITVRGETDIEVSPLLCLRFFADERNSHLLDDLFDSAPIIEKVNKHTELRNLRYKTIWPLKKRDFSVILCGLQVKTDAWCVLCFSLNNLRCPENPNYVRGEVLAGYLVTGDIAKNSCHVTYVLSIDLKGSIPSWAINRVMNSQPLIIDKAKNFLEGNQNDTNSIPQIFFAPESAIPPKIQVSNQLNEDHPEASANDVCNESIFEASMESSKEYSIQVTESDTDFKLYTEISNSLLHSVQEEIKEALQVEINFNRVVLDYGSSHFGKWQFIGFEKQIVLMRKQISSSVYGFLGMGLIKHHPLKVFEVLRNPQNRFVYDNMVKDISVLKEFGNGMYILKMLHEHNQCFVKKSRESCLLVSEHIIGPKYSIVSRSVDNSLWPESESIKRLNLKKAGWVIEQREKNGKIYSKVYYIIHIDLAEIPLVVINHIGKRQPLSIAYLREFISQTNS